MNTNGTQKQNGQGLVELAVITPILIFMLLGLIEVGYYLWGYMTVLNVDREAARYAVLPGVLETGYTEDGYIILSGYSGVITHAIVSGGENNNLRLCEYLDNEKLGNDKPKAQIIITVLGAETNEPCYPAEDCYAYEDVDGNIAPKCDTSAAYYHDNIADDLFVSPQNNGTMLFVYPISAASRSLVSDYQAQLAAMKVTNDKLNCLFGAASGEIWTNDVAVTVEIYYEQPQLLGFPLFVWLPDPLPIYTKSTFNRDRLGAFMVEPEESEVP